MKIIETIIRIYMSMIWLLLALMYTIAVASPWIIGGIVIIKLLVGECY